MNRRILAFVVALACVVGVLAVPVSAASAEGTTCAEVIEQLRVELQRGASPAMMQVTARRHPECAAQIRHAAEAARAQIKAPGEDAQGFLGPIGWIWNHVYYKVYQGNIVMMLTFGWGLLLAPILVVVCAYCVMRGANGAFRRPTASPPVALTTRD